MKKRISLFMAAIMVLTVMLSAIPIAAATNTFNASDANPTISTAEDYIAFFRAAFIDKTSDFSGKTITMKNDITLNDTSVSNWYAQANAVKLVAENTDWEWFNGTFDGGNYTLKGVIVEGTFRNDMVTGIFPYVGDGGAIKNLVIDGFYVCSDNTTEAIGSNGRVGTGGLIGMAYKNVTVDNVTMKNGTVTCVENGKGALGALVGSYKADQWYAGIPNQNLKITNTKVDKTVRVVAPANSSVYMGGLMGHVNTVCTDGVHVDLTGSIISPAKSIGLDRTLQPFGNFFFDSAGGYIWYFDVNGRSSSVRIDRKETCTDKFNSAVLGTGCYGVEDDSDNTFSIDDYDNQTTFYVTTATDLEAFLKFPKDFKGKTVELCADIVLNDTSAEEWYKADGVIMLNAEASNYFQGTFDGKGYTIKGYVSKISSFDQWYKATGLFKAARGATIKDFTMDGFYIESTNGRATGAIIGRMDRGSVLSEINLKNGTVKATNIEDNIERGVGAIFGFANMNNGDADIYRNVEIKDCVVDDSVTVIGESTVDAWAGGIGGRFYANDKIGSFYIDLTGSKIFPTDANGEAIAPIAFFDYTSATVYEMTVKNESASYSETTKITQETPELTALLNGQIEKALTYVVEFVGLQMRTSDNAARFVGLIKAPMNGEEVDLSRISSLGFEITVGDKTVGPDVVKCTKVYASIMENGNPKAAPEGYYYFTFVITGVSDNTVFDVRACATINGIDYSTAVGTCTYPPANS